MPRQKESPLELLLKLPWWISAALGVISFIALRWLIPAKIDHNQALHPFAVALPKLAVLPLGLFTLIAIGSFLFSKKRHRLVDEQTSLEKLRETNWKDFEILVAEAYRRQGYQVEYSLGQGADGGVDLTLRRDGRTSLVQCKQWKVFSVGAPVIREMFGLMTAERADEAIIVTSGKFTRDAQDFAAGKPIHLIDGPQLLTLIHSVQSGRGGTGDPPVPFGDSPKAPQIPTSSPSPLSPSPTGMREGARLVAPEQSGGGRPGEGCRDKTSHGGEGRGEVSTPAAAPSGAVSADPVCPSCGQPMILRTSKRGTNAGSQFWGCSTYPACTGTRKYINFPIH